MYHVTWLICRAFIRRAVCSLTTNHHIENPNGNIFPFGSHNQHRIRSAIACGTYFRTTAAGQILWFHWCTWVPELDLRVSILSGSEGAFISWGGFNFNPYVPSYVHHRQNCGMAFREHFLPSLLLLRDSYLSVPLWVFGQRGLERFFFKYFYL